MGRTGKNGKIYTWNVKQEVMGLQREEVAKRLIEIYELDMTPEEYNEKMDEQIDMLMGDSKLLEGN